MTVIWSSLPRPKWIQLAPSLEMRLLSGVDEEFAWDLFIVSELRGPCGDSPCLK